ncbi:DNA-binding transcriptional LysR family regulator [Bradyrhizobium sp. LM2.7]
MQMSDRIGKRIRLQDVHVLMAVVQAGSMGKAARHLNTSQPNISKAIGDLERALGVRLLDRHRHGIEPTEYGRALLDGGAIVFDELRQTVKNIEFLADPTAGEVRIGSNTALAASFTSTVIDRLTQRYPRMTVRLVSGFNETLLEKLRARDLDLLIARRFGAIDGEPVDFESLFDDTCVIAAGAQSPWVRRRRIALAELINEPWVLPPRGTGVISIAQESFRAAGLDYPRTVVVADSPLARMNLLTTGRFLTIFTVSTLRFPVRRPELKVLPVELSPARFPNGIVTLKNRTLTPVARLFIETAREVARPLAKRS